MDARLACEKHREEITIESREHFTPTGSYHKVRLLLSTQQAPFLPVLTVFSPTN
jgi:hypothetical protein